MFETQNETGPATSLDFPFVSLQLIQAFENYKNSSTGQLSFVTILLLFLGALARIFTSYQDTKDKILILTFVSSAFFNGILVSQVLYYWNSKPKEKQL